MTTNSEFLSNKYSNYRWDMVSILTLRTGYAFGLHITVFLERATPYSSMYSNIVNVSALDRILPDTWQQPMEC